jgi:pilus assembly protein Flp/PilA
VPKPTSSWSLPGPINRGEKRVPKPAVTFYKDENGATAVEYGLIVAAIAGLIIAIVFVIGNKVKNGFNNVQSAM